MRFSLTVVWLMLLLAGLAWSDPLVLPPAPFTLNDMVTMCEVNHGGRVVLRYDVRPAGGQGLKLQLFLGRGKNIDKPVREYTFTGPTGTHRLDLKGVPIAVYRVQGIPVGADGQTLSGGERPVYLCWGGGRAWRAYDKGSLDAKGEKAPFQDAKASNDPNAPTLEVDPPGVVVNQGDSTELKAYLRGLGAEEELDWRLEGSGELKVFGRRATYIAEKKAGMGRNAVIHVSSRSHPELKANVTVVVTGVSRSELKNP